MIARVKSVKKLFPVLIITMTVSEAAGGLASAADAPAELAFTADKRYLNLPVKNGAPMRRMSLVVEEKKVREFEIELADAKPDFWVFLDLEPFRGRKAVLKVDGLAKGSEALKLVEQSDSIKGADDLYREKLRPQFHFTSRRGWLNDPNGLMYYKGEYHLFYQHNPYGVKWGNMHWGHAVSKDLVHWKEQPIALYPQRFGDWCFSGSAAIMTAKMIGQPGARDLPIIAYTSTGRGECIAIQDDDGEIILEDDNKEPVIKHRGRDPRIFWHQPTNRWVIAVYDEQGKSQGIAFYTSQDLVNWERRSRIEGWFECPEIFELPVDGDKNNTRWVVYAANNEYSLGSFDGKEFKAEPGTGKYKGNFGNCLYAAQTFSNIPADDGRRIQIAWARIDFPGMPFNQMMTFPVELTLRKTDEGIRLFANPAREIEKLHAKKHAWENLTIDPRTRLVEDTKGDLWHIRAVLEPRDAARAGFEIRGTNLTYDAKKQQLICKNASAAVRPIDGEICLEILVDRTSVEVFANGGRVYMPVGVIHPEEKHQLVSFSEGGSAKVKRLEVHELKSAWE
jgi:fructan beta-fructosidase